jgi:hypothetical protein
VPLLIPKFASEVPRVLANFGIGALGTCRHADHNPRAIRSFMISLVPA